MPPRHQEEVLNTVLAEVIVTRGLHTSLETICRRGSQRPDVLISLGDLWRVIEDKITDVSKAKSIVQNNIIDRIDPGLTHYCGHGENC